jgi:predicted glycosyltransferase
MVLLNTHPDYMDFRENKCSPYHYPSARYVDLLRYLEKQYQGEFWNALPMDVAESCRNGCDEVVLEDKCLPGQESRDAVRVNAGNGRKIWVDLDNSPHVPFFKPIITRLEKDGYPVILSARDCFQVCDLADKLNLSYRRIGKHYGKNKLFKVIGTVIRATQLVPLLAEEHPVISVSHGSRSQVIASALFKIPSLTLFDYEFSRKALTPTWVMAPELIPDDAVPFKKEMVLRYPGIKENVYVPDFKPDPGIEKDLELSPDDLVVTVRPPATEAHYFRPESESLFEAVVDFLGNQSHLKMIMLPRNERQEEFIRSKWHHLIDNKILKIPPKVVDGLNLIWYSDLVVSGGGTMNREAAALGVPVYSIFRGTIGAVDKYLSSVGRLTLVESKDQIETKIILKKREKNVRVHSDDVDALTRIVELIKQLADGKKLQEA